MRTIHENGTCEMVIQVFVQQVRAFSHNSMASLGLYHHPWAKGFQKRNFWCFSPKWVWNGGKYPVYPQVYSGHFDGTCGEHEVKKTSGTWGVQHLPKLRIGLVIKMCYVGAFPQGAAGSHPNGCELQTLGRIGGTWDSDRTGFMLNYTYGPTNSYKWSYNSYY